MVDDRKGTIRLEIVPWLTEPFGHRGSSRLVLEQEIAGPMRLGDLLASLAGTYPAFGVAVLDLEAGRLFEHVTVVRNGTALGSDSGLAEVVKAGDSVVLLPAFSGG